MRRPLEVSGPEFTAGQICGACGGELLHGTFATGVRGISTDTRTIGDGQAFFALEGSRHDAHDYIPAALDSGARIIVCHKKPRSLRLPPRSSIVLVDDTLQALLRLAAWHRDRLQGVVIGITGSCGKSTVKEMTGAILSEGGRCTVARESFNNRIGVSLTLLDALPEDDYVVLELGANHRGEIDELARIARPDAGCITCIGRSHLEGFGGLEGVREAKSELIPHIARDGFLVLYGDQARCRSLGQRYGGEVQTFGFSPEADVRIAEVKSGSRGELFSIGEVVFHIPLTGRHNVLNAGAAFCLARWAGACEGQALRALGAVRLPGLRCERRWIGGVEFVLDCYNSNPTAMQAACEAFARTKAPGRRIVVCGDMLELGDEAASLHEDTGRMIAESGVDMLVAVGGYADHVVKGWRKASPRAQNAISLPSREKAWLFIHRITRRGDAVMMKGSRKLRLEEVVDSIGEYVTGLEQEAA